MVTTKLNLSMTEPQVRQIYAKQGDTGRVLDITLDQTPEDGTLRILRPDGAEVTSEAVTGGEVGSGSSFESLAEADVTELTVGIEPVQDFNGYDKPWVGGAGKNKLNMDALQIGKAWNGSSSTARAVVYSVCQPNTQYTLSFSGADAFEQVLIVEKTSEDATTNNRLTTVTSSYTFTTDSTSGVFGLQFNKTAIASSDFANFTAQIELGYTATAWQPYSNICPITGHDEVRVYDDPVYGKTIKWNQLIKNGNFADTSNWSWFSGMTVTVSGNVATVTTPGQWNQLSQVFDWAYGHVMLATASVKKVGESGNVVVKVTNDFAYTNQQFAKAISTNDVWTDVVMCGKYTVTPEGSTSQIRIGVQEYRPSNSNNGFQVKNVEVFDLTEMFGEGNEPTIEEFEALFPKDYYPYNTGEETTVSAVNGDPNRQYTTSLGQTVYGGTLDMVSGVLTVDRAMVDLGSLSWIKEGVPDGYRFRVPLSGAQVADAEHKTAICTQYALLVAGETYARQQGFTIASNGNFYIYDETQESATASGFKTAMNGVTCVYSLTEPVTYQLTAQQIKTLVGTNNVWASSGDIVNITFTYGGLLSELPSEATEIVGKCYCDVEQNGVSSMPFTLNIKKNERQ